MDKSNQVTSSLQDYLETILSLSKHQDNVRVTDIAQNLNIAKASVSQALQVLKERGFINHSRYGPVELTSKGLEHAKKIEYRHEVLRYFLMELLGVSPETAEADACLLEHDLSAESFEKLLTFLEEGKRNSRFKREVFCNYDEDLSDINTEDTLKKKTLVNMKTGQSGKIISIGGGQPLEKKLEQLGIRQGTIVKKVSSAFAHGPVTVNIGGCQIAIGYGKATRISVEVIEDEKDRSGR